MNTPSPLVPQGTSPDRGKSNLYIKVLVILMLHVVVIGGMLLQGCKENKTNASNNPGDQTANNNVDTNPPPVVEPPPLPSTTNPPPAIGAPASSYATAPAPTATPGLGTNPINNMAPPPVTASAPMPAPAQPAAGGEYVVARGDTLATIAKKNGVTLKALRAANPGVDPRKLKIGAKLQLPESANVAAAATAAGAPGAAPGAGTETGDVTVYTVKAGDMLGRIAKSHGTTVAKIKALNDLKTTSIKVGQKLKLPGAKAPEPSTAATAPGPSTTATTEPTSGGIYAAAQPAGAMTH